jgi:hypothetical protein
MPLKRALRTSATAVIMACASIASLVMGVVLLFVLGPLGAVLGLAVLVLGPIAGARAARALRVTRSPSSLLAGPAIAGTALSTSAGWILGSSLIGLDTINWFALGPAGATVLVLTALIETLKPEGATKT